MDDGPTVKASIPWRGAFLDQINSMVPPNWQWEAVKLSGMPEQPSAIRAMASPHAQLIQMTCGTAASLRLQPPPATTCLLIRLSEDSNSRLNGRSLQLNEPALLLPGRGHQLVTGQNAAFMLLSCTGNLVPVSIPTGERRSIREQISGAIQRNCAHPECLEQDLKTLLASLRSSLRPVSAATRFPARHHLAWKAEAELRANLRSNINIRELSARLEICERLLRKGFVEWFGTSPTAWVKALRLQQIRRELQAHPGHRATITTVASGWGITHMGRFSADYRNFFGEYPSATLQHRRRATSAGSVRQLAGAEMSDISVSA